MSQICFTGPFFESSSRALNYLVSGWQISGIARVQSGRPYSVFSSSDSAGTSLSQRADFVGCGNGLTPTSGLDPRTQTGPTRDCFDIPVPNADGTGRQGTSGRSAFIGPGYRNMDLSIIKKFGFGREDRFKFSLRGDFFNLFNNVNFAQPVNTIDSSNFGQSTGTFRSRVVQLAGRFNF